MLSICFLHSLTACFRGEQTTVYGWVHACSSYGFVQRKWKHSRSAGWLILYWMIYSDAIFLNSKLCVGFMKLFLFLFIGSVGSEMAWSSWLCEVAVVVASEFGISGDGFLRCGLEKIWDGCSHAIQVGFSKARSLDPNLLSLKSMVKLLLISMGADLGQCFGKVHLSGLILTSHADCCIFKRWQVALL